MIVLATAKTKPTARHAHPRAGTSTARGDSRWIVLLLLSPLLALTPGRHQTGIESVFQKWSITNREGPGQSLHFGPGTLRKMSFYTATLSQYCHSDRRHIQLGKKADHDISQYEVECNRRD
jgi:hypothetical protein